MTARSLRTTISRCRYLKKALFIRPDRLPHGEQAVTRGLLLSTREKLAPCLVCTTKLLFSSSSKISEKSISYDRGGNRSIKIQLLHQQLSQLNISGNEMHDAAIQSVNEPMKGYDYRFGKSSIKTYKSYVFKGNGKDDHGIDDANYIMKTRASATRVARQIDFLIKRHQSHEAEWVRHTDNESATQSEVKRKPFPIIVLLDNVRSAYNVGSIFRTADACNVQMVVTSGITPHPFGSGSDKLRKSALGSDLLVANKHFSSTSDAIQYIRTTCPNYRIFGMETTERSIPYTNITYPGGSKSSIDEDCGSIENSRNSETTATTINKDNTLKIEEGTVLILGNEVTGVDTNILHNNVDDVIEIPMYGSKNSLNIASCLPVVLYEIIRQWSI